MNGYRSHRISRTPGNSHRSRGSVGFLAEVAYSGEYEAARRFKRGKGIFQKSRGQSGSRNRAFYGHNDPARGRIHSVKGWFEMIKNLSDLFRKKTEDSMQERAQKSRRLKNAEDRFNEKRENLNTLIEEMKKKTHG